MGAHKDNDGGDGSGSAYFFEGVHNAAPQWATKWATATAKKALMARIVQADRCAAMDFYQDAEACEAAISTTVMAAIDCVTLSSYICST